MKRGDRVKQKRKEKKLKRKSKQPKKGQFFFALSRQNITTEIALFAGALFTNEIEWEDFDQSKIYQIGFKIRQQKSDPKGQYGIILANKKVPIRFKGYIQDNFSISRILRSEEQLPVLLQNYAISKKEHYLNGEIPLILPEVKFLPYRETKNYTVRNVLQRSGFELENEAFYPNPIEQMAYKMNKLKTSLNETYGVLASYSKKEVKECLNLENRI